MNFSWLAALGFLLSTPTVHACTKQMPEGLAGVAVGSDVVTHGLAMSISQVQSRESVDTVLTRTAKAWKEAGYLVKRSTTAGWEVVAAMGDQCLLTLQLSSRNGAFGYLARSRKSTVMAVTPHSMGAPIPAGAKVTSSVASNDDGRKGLTISMTSPRSMEALNQFFMEQLANNKWAATRAHKVNNKKTGVSSLFVSAQRNRQQIEIVIWPERGTQIVMTVSEAL